MINIQPTIRPNELLLKQTAAAPIHTTGDFYMHNIFSASNGLIQQVDFDFTNHLNQTDPLYTGQLKITATGTRDYDGSTIDIGSASFYISSSAVGALSSNKISATPNWNSWVLRGAGTGFEDYINADFHTVGNKLMQFYKSEFCLNEVDPVHNIIFQNTYSIDIVFTVEYLNRKTSPITNINTIRCVDNQTGQITASADVVLRPEINTEQGTLSGNVDTFLGKGLRFPGSVLIQSDASFDFLLNGTFNSISGSLGGSRIRPFSSLDKSNTNDRNDFISDFLTQMRSQVFSGVPNANYPIGRFQVDFNDTTYNTGNNITLYHQTAWTGTTSGVGLNIGYTNFDADSVIVPSTFPSAGTTLQSFGKFPELTHHGNVAFNTGIPFTQAPIIPCLITNTRCNDRPIIYVRQNTIGFVINNGTHAVPVYNRVLSTNTNTGLSDTSIIKYSHNSAAVPADFKGVTLVNAKEASDGWTYISAVASTGHRLLARMQYIGPGGGAPSLADCWNWTNWSVEVLAKYANPGTSTPIQTANSNVSFTFTNFPAASVLYGDVDSGSLNGFPVFYGFVQNKFCKFYHNGGSSATLSDNWTIELLAGGTSTTSTLPIKGTAFSCDFTGTIGNNWYYRKQIVGDWFYFSSNDNHYVGRININQASADYLRFEYINQITSLHTAENSF